VVWSQSQYNDTQKKQVHLEVSGVEDVAFSHVFGERETVRETDGKIEGKKNMTGRACTHGVHHENWDFL
jgi:hypothetical protein